MKDFEVIGNLGVIIAASISFISLFCSLCTVYIIWDMNKWNNFMRLIYNLSVCQVFSDLSFIFTSYSLYHDNSEMAPLRDFLFTFGGVSVALWTNVISCLLFNVVIYRKNLNLLKNFEWIRAIVLIPGLSLAILVAVYMHKYFEIIETTILCLQIASTIFNILITIAVTIKLYYMNIEHQSTEVTNKNRETTSTSYNTSDINKPIIELTRRIKYYPIVQIVCLFGVIWYFFGVMLAMFGPSHNGTWGILAWYAYCILSPLTGTAYFIVFLIVQPYAYNHLKVRIRELLGLHVDRTMSVQSENCRISTATSIGVRTNSIMEEAMEYNTSSSIGVVYGESNSSSHSTLSESTMDIHNNSTSSSNLGSLGDCKIMDEDTLINRIEAIYATKQAASMMDVELTGGNPIHHNNNVNDNL